MEASRGGSGDGADRQNHADPVTALRDAGISAQLLEPLSGAFSPLRLTRYDPGETIYRQGGGVEALYLLLDGRVKLLIYNQDGSARIVRLHRRGSILGLNGLFEEKHDHNAVAIDEVVLYRLPIGAIRNIEDEDAEAYARLLEYSHEYLKDADTWIIEFSTGDIRARVARLVLYLGAQDDSSDSDEVDLLTVNEMAQIIGVTPESVSRTLADFKRKDFLSPLDDESPDTYRCDRRALKREAGN